MLGLRRINDGVALWNIRMTAWLIENYGAPLTPPTPNPLNYQQPLHLRHWSPADTRLPLQWAQDEFALICEHMHMGSLNISLIPETHASARGEPLSANRTFTGGWQRALKTRVKLDVNGNPIVSYDPLKCKIPGYLSARVIMDLSKIYIGSRMPPADFDSFFEIPLTLLGAAHLGQGFTITSFSPDLIEEVIVGRPLRAREMKEFLDVVTFVSVLGLSCRRLSPEQMIGSFGKIMTTKTRKKVWKSYLDVMEFDTEVQALRNMCGGIAGTSNSTQRMFKVGPVTRTPHASHSPRHQAQL